MTGEFLLVRSGLIPTQVGAFTPRVKLLFLKILITKLSLYIPFTSFKGNSSSLTSKFYSIFILHSLKIRWYLGKLIICCTASIVSEYGVISGPYFPVFKLNTYLSVFSSNTGKYGPEITPYWDTFHAVLLIPFKLTLFLRGSLIFEVGFIWSNVIAVLCAGDIPSQWIGIRVIEIVHCC